MFSTLLLVDGYAAVYRAFYAIKELSSSSGQPTNALYGFIRMLNQLKDSVSPSHIAVVFDGGLPEERMELVPEYKAQRPSMPDDLSSQLELIDEYLDAVRIRTYEMEGEEADDVLAAIACNFSDQFERILIATGDKDLFQVVDERIMMIQLSGSNEISGPEEIKAKTGVTPVQTLEWLAMMGDSADNIPGVPGVGSKTAARLLNQFGCLDDLYKNIEDVQPERIRGLMKDNREIVDRNVAMMRLNRDLECVESLDDLKAAQPDNGLLLSFFEKVEFAAMAKAIREPELF